MNIKQTSGGDLDVPEITNLFSIYLFCYFCLMLLLKDSLNCEPHSQWEFYLIGYAL